MLTRDIIKLWMPLTLSNRLFTTPIATIMNRTLLLTNTVPRANIGIVSIDIGQLLTITILATLPLKRTVGEAWVMRIKPQSEVNTMLAPFIQTAHSPLPPRPLLTNSKSSNLIKDSCWEMVKKLPKGRMYQLLAIKYKQMSQSFLRFSVRRVINPQS